MQDTAAQLLREISLLLAMMLSAKSVLDDMQSTAVILHDKALLVITPMPSASANAFVPSKILSRQMCLSICPVVCTDMQGTACTLYLCTSAEMMKSATSGGSRLARAAGRGGQPVHSMVAGWCAWQGGPGRADTPLLACPSSVHKCAPLLRLTLWYTAQKWQRGCICVSTNILRTMTSYRGKCALSSCCLGMYSAWKCMQVMQDLLVQIGLQM